MQLLTRMIRQFGQWLTSGPNNERRQNRRALLEHLQPRVLLAGIPVDDAWKQVRGTVIENDSTGAYIQLTPAGEGRTSGGPRASLLAQAPIQRPIFADLSLAEGEDTSDDSNSVDSSSDDSSSVDSSSDDSSSGGCGPTTTTTDDSSADGTDDASSDDSSSDDSSSDGTDDSSSGGCGPTTTTTDDSSTDDSSSSDDSSSDDSSSDDSSSNDSSDDSSSGDSDSTGDSDSVDDSASDDSDDSSSDDSSSDGDGDSSSDGDSTSTDGGDPEPPTFMFPPPQTGNVDDGPPSYFDDPLFDDPSSSLAPDLCGCGCGEDTSGEGSGSGQPPDSSVNPSGASPQSADYYDSEYIANSFMKKGLCDDADSCMQLSYDNANSTGIFTPKEFFPSSPPLLNAFGMMSGAADSGMSSHPIRYFDGTAILAATDLSSRLGGVAWGITRSWTNGGGYAQENIVGSGMVIDQQPTLIQLDGNNSLSLILNGHDARFFDLNGTEYEQAGFTTHRLEHDAFDDTFTVTDTSGNQLVFFGFSSTDPTEPAGKLCSLIDPSGRAMAFTYNSSSQLVSVLRSATIGNIRTDEEFVYSYVTTGTNAGLLKSVLLHRREGTISPSAPGSWSTVRKASYAYYGNGDAYGNAGDLETVKIKDGSGNVLDTTYYRYYTADDIANDEQGYVHGLKYIFKPKSFARLDAAVADPFSATDGQVAAFADHYFEYDEEHRVTREDAQGAGCSSGGGLGTYLYSYDTSDNDPGTNSWAVRTTEVLPDGNENVVYNNSYGQVMLKAYHDTTLNQTWSTFYKFDDAGHVVLQANPSAVSGYDDQYPDLLHDQSGNYEFMTDSVGLIISYVYYTTTTASAETAGGVDGYLNETDLRHGETGTSIKQSQQSYISHTAFDQTIYLVAATTVYANDNGTGDLTTTYDYTFHTVNSEDTLKTKTKTTTSPAGDTTDLVYDLFGRVIWSRDSAGFINYNKYNQRTGSLIKSIVDVDTSESNDFSGLPAGWSSPTEHPLHLITKYQVDALGRTTRLTDANGNQAYVIYNDVDHEMRVYAGWNNVTNQPTGPTVVTREDREHNYTESLTMSAAPATVYDASIGGYKPTGAEEIDDLQSLSRNYFNTGGQLIETHDYFSFDDMSYDTEAVLGEDATNYYVSTFDFDNGGRKNRIVRGDGTIFRTVYDGQGRVVSTWVGDDDVPSEGDWSPANHAEMIRTSLNDYDSSGVGDGYLTSVTDALGRVTSFGYDFRGRQNSQTLPDPDGSGSGHPLNSPVSYTEYDNLGRVTSMTDALGNETTIAYSLNTTYHTSTVTTTYPDPDGSGSGHSLTSPVVSKKYDSRGLLVSVTDALSNVTTYAYDGAGRLITATLPDPDGSGSGHPLTSPVTSYSYDNNGNLTSTTDPLGNVTTKVYDRANRLITVILPDPDGTDSGHPLTSPQTSYAYNAAGMLLSETDPLSRVTSKEYDALGRLTLVTLPDPDGAGSGHPLTAPTAGYTYDGASHKMSVTDALGNVTSYTYNVFDQVLTVTQPDPDGSGSGHPLIAPVRTYAYDNAGQLTNVTDPLGNVTSFTYDYLGRKITMTAPDPDGSGSGHPLTSPVTTYAYDAVGNVTAVADPLGHVTTNTYDNLYRLLSVTQPDPDGSGSGHPLAAPVTNYAYDVAGRVTSVTDPLSHITSYAYDNLGRKITVTAPDPDGSGPLASPVTSYTYDAVGNQISVTDPLGNVTTNAYDNLYRLLSVTQPDPDGTGSGHPLTSPVTSYAYDDAGQLTSVTDPLGNVTIYTYDNLGRKLTVTAPDPDGTGSGHPLTSPVITYAYDAVGNVTAVTDPLGHVTTNAYDNLYRLLSVTQPDPDGSGSLTSPVTTFAYDAAGHMTSVTDPLSHVTCYTYDNLGRKITVTAPDPDGSGSLVAPVTSYAYDAVGNQISVTDPLGNVTTYEYDNLYRLMAVVQPDPDGSGSLISPETAYTYDAAGHRLTLRDPGGNVTTWYYDALGRVTGEVNYLNDARNFSYDAAGNLTQLLDRDDRVTAYVYDNLNRRVAEKWMDGTTVVRTISFTYDAASQLTAVADPDSEYALTFDHLGRTLTVSNAGTSGAPTVVLTSSYDANSRRTDLAAVIGSNDDFLNGYTYDDLGRLTRIEQTGQSGGNAVANKAVNYAYNANSRLTTVTGQAKPSSTWNEVATSTFTYDALDRLTSLEHKHSTTTIASYGWTFDVGSRITYLSGPDGTSDYTYDDTNQLVGADHSYQTDETYSYDENGNRTGGSYDTGDNNQLLADNTYDYDYDAEDNRTLRTNRSSGAVTEYTWDYRNRLTKVVERGSSTGAITKQTEYTYDLLNQRIKKSYDADGAGSGSATVTRYVYDGQNPVLQFDGSGNLTHRYLDGPGIEPILADEAVTSLSSAGAVLWPLTDNIGTVRDLVNSSGSVQNHLKYDSFGQVTNELNSAVDFLFGYAAGIRDEETDLQYHHARYYDPAVGRWLSQDPIGFLAGDANLARYAANSPLNSADPTGLIVPGPGHHLVNQATWKDLGLDEKVQQVFDADDARIYAEYYTFHNSGTANGVTHIQYNQEVKKELRSFLGTSRDPSSMTVTEAKEFLENIKTSKNPLIEAFNIGVESEAYAAHVAGVAAEVAATNKGMSPAAVKNAIKDAADAAAKKTRSYINDRVKQAAASVVGKTKSIVGKICKVLPFVSAGVVLFHTGDVSAAGREVFLEVTGLDLARDAAEFLGVGFEYLQNDVEKSAKDIHNKFNFNPLSQ